MSELGGARSEGHIFTGYVSPKHVEIHAVYLPFRLWVCISALAWPATYGNEGRNYRRCV